MKLKFRAFKDNEYIYSFTKDGVDRLGWFFSNMKGCPIEQWTGLTDQSGRDIYEGDFIKYDYGNRITLVSRTTEGYDNHPAFIIQDAWDQHGGIEVIGNENQNPELFFTQKLD